MLGGHDEHRPFEDYAVRHVMGGLDEAESGTFRSHLLDCSECRARVGELRSIASELAEVERTERRERSARVVETKEREARPIQDPNEMPTSPPRGFRVATVVGLLLVMVLSVWNVVLRGQSEGLRDTVAELAAQTETITFGDPWTTEQLATRYSGVARELDGQLAVMVRGASNGATYRLTLTDAAGIEVRSHRVGAVEGQIRWFEPLPADIARVQVALPRSSGETIIFRATAPQPPGG